VQGGGDAGEKMPVEAAISLVETQGWTMGVARRAAPREAAAALAGRAPGARAFV